MAGYEPWQVTMQRVFSIAMVLWSVGFCDIAPLGSVGGNVYPITSKNVAMVSESVKVVVLAESLIVNATFHLHNKGDAQNLLMGFPDFIDGAGSSLPLRNFRVKVAGQEIEPKRARVSTVYGERKGKSEHHGLKANPAKLAENNSGLPEPLAIDVGLRNYEEHGFHEEMTLHWYQWPSRINAGQKTTVEVSYTGDWSQYYMTALYLIGTGKYWSEPIGKGYIVFDHSKYRTDLFYGERQMYVKKDSRYDFRPLGREVKKMFYEDSVVYTFNNYRPKEDEAVYVVFNQHSWVGFGDIVTLDKMSPETIQTVIDKRCDASLVQDSSVFQNTSLLHDTPAFAARLVSTDYGLSHFLSANRITSTLDKYHFAQYVELLARHGYVFKDPELRSFFSGKTWYKPASRPTWESCPTGTVYYIRALNRKFHGVLDVAIPDSIRYPIARPGKRKG